VWREDEGGEKMRVEKRGEKRGVQQGVSRSIFEEKAVVE
jgi:hypothetical protein